MRKIGRKYGPGRAALLLIIMLFAILPFQCKKFEVTRKVILSTDAVAGVSHTSCIVSATIMDLNDQEFSSHGFHWTKSMDAVLAYDTVDFGHAGGTGQFTHELWNFEPGTKYYIWAYVNDGSGEIKGNILEFTTLPGGVPSVETGMAQALSPFMGECTYSVINDNGAPLIERGLCWDTLPDPDLEDMHSTHELTMGELTEPIEGLIPEKDYYVRGWARNSRGIGFGEVKVFSTPPASEAPLVETLPVEEIRPTRVLLRGRVNEKDLYELDQRGFCYGTEPNPDLLGPAIFDPFPSFGNYEYELAGLEPRQTYFVRAFVIDKKGKTQFAEQVEFAMPLAIPGEVLHDERDGKDYPTVLIGEQLWMARNLDIGNKINGSLNPKDDDVIEKYYFQNNDVYGERYGGLYTWDEMMQYNYDGDLQGVCPAGWHIPSDEEWKVLERTLGMGPEVADAEGWRGGPEGGMLKLEGEEFWNSPNTGASNESGFNAIPGGSMDHVGYFSSVGNHAHFWSSTWVEPDPWFRLLQNDHVDILREKGDNRHAKSVRCVKD